MVCNVGGVDKIVRILIGVAVLVAGLTTHHWWGWLGLIPLATAVVGCCPLYLPFKMSTRKAAPAKQ